MGPRSELLRFPREYGASSETLPWETVSEKLRAAPFYWFASTRSDGRPHVVPRDGVWLDDALWYGGSDETIHNRIIAQNPNVVASVGEGLEAVIVEGVVQRVTPPRELAQRLAEATQTKYPQYGKADPQSYAGGVTALQPRRVLAWTSFPTNATRFLFEQR